MTAGVTALAFSFARVTAAESELITVHLAAGNGCAAAEFAGEPRAAQPAGSAANRAGQPAGGLQCQPGRISRQLDSCLSTTSVNPRRARRDERARRTRTTAARARRSPADRSPGRSSSSSRSGARARARDRPPSLAAAARRACRGSPTRSARPYRLPCRPTACAVMSDIHIPGPLHWRSTFTCPRRRPRHQDHRVPPAGPTIATGDQNPACRLLVNPAPDIPIPTQARRPPTAAAPSPSSGPADSDPNGCREDSTSTPVANEASSPSRSFNAPRGGRR